MATAFSTWEEFWEAYAEQTRFIIRRCAELYETSESIRARFCPTPYLSCLVKGCAEKGLDITQGGAELSFTTLEAVTFATTVDSLLAIKYLVFDKKECTMAELIAALKANWEGHEKLQAKARFKAPKYGRDDDEADAMAKGDGALVRGDLEIPDRLHEPPVPAGDAELELLGGRRVHPAGKPGRETQREIPLERHLPVQRRGHQRSHGQRQLRGQGDGREGRGRQRRLSGVLQLPAQRRQPHHHHQPLAAERPGAQGQVQGLSEGLYGKRRERLQINMLDAEMLRDAQKRPEEYRSLLVRITGYNAYFTTIGRELQDEVIARISHESL